MVCTSRRGCEQVVGGVYKSQVGFTSRRWCLQVVGVVYKSKGVFTSRRYWVQVTQSSTSRDVCKVW